MTYDKAYFIAKFEAIPEDKWTTENFIDERGCCALGHCGFDSLIETREGNDLILLLKWHFGFGPSRINDGRHSRYQQPTPKQRVLAALKDLP
jgi:hypothetical protein